MWESEGAMHAPSDSIATPHGIGYSCFVGELMTGLRGGVPSTR